MSCSPASAVVTNLQRACRAGGVRPEGGAEGLGSAPHRKGGLESVRGCLQATEQGLERGAALLKSISGVRGGEEHRCGESRAATGEVQAKAHSREQGLPPRDPAHLTGPDKKLSQEPLYMISSPSSHFKVEPSETDLVLHALLGRVHGVALAALNPLQRLLNLWTPHVLKHREPVVVVIQKAEESILNESLMCRKLQFKLPSLGLTW